MKIVGGHDYYDSAIQYGIDDTIVFVREKDRKIDTKDGPFLERDLNLVLEDGRGRRVHTDRRNYINSSTRLERISVLFCGKMYNGFHVPAVWGTKDRYIWSFNEYVKFLEELGLHIPKEQKYTYKGKPDSTNYLETVKSYFTPVAQDGNKDWAITNNVTIAVLQWGDLFDSKKCWFLNPSNLKSIQFYKVMDAFTAFQEISMWVGGVLAGQGNKMVEITDNNMKIRKAGHDPKVSFRKAKGS